MNAAKLCRFEKGMTVSAVAAATGLSRQTITTLEKGETISAPTAKKIADVYGVTVAELLGLAVSPTEAAA